MIQINFMRDRGIFNSSGIKLFILFNNQIYIYIYIYIYIHIYYTKS